MTRLAVPETPPPTPPPGQVSPAPRLVLLSQGTGEPGRARDGRRGRPQTRPGLPLEDDNPWRRSVLTWSDYLDQRLSDTERANYVKRVGWLAGDHSDRSPWTLTTEDLGAWLDAQPWSIGTRRKVVVAARNYYAWALSAGLCRRSPLAGVATTAPRSPGPRAAATPPSWEQPLRDWVTWLHGSARTEATIRTRTEHLGSLAQLHAEPWSITAGDLARWLSRPDWAPATKRTHRASARSFYSWAVRAGLTATDPSADLDPIRQRRTLPRPTPTDVLREAIDQADDRARIALQLALYAGLRRAEIAGLHTRDIGQHALHVRGGTHGGGKGGNGRLIPLHPDLARVLRDELARRRDGTDIGRGWGAAVPAVDGWLFPAKDPDQHITPRWLGRIVGQALGPGWTTHTVRHLFATQAYGTQRDLRAVQELLGHSKPETTARYAAVPDGARAAAVLGVGI